MKILLLTLLLTGCATSGWYHPGLAKSQDPQTEWKKDWYYCEARNRSGHPSMMLVDMQNAFECMQMEKGWTKQ